MTTLTGSDELRAAQFVGVDLRDARFVGADLSGAVLRGVEVAGADIDAPWLGDGTLVVNGVDVVPFVQAELDRRFPGRAGRRAADPDGLRAAWAALERSWAVTVERAGAMPARTNPWAPDQPETVRSCPRTILEEEWEHHRYAVRDLDAIASAAPA